MNNAQPTPEDLARDLAADLELCERTARNLPWEERAFWHASCIVDSEGMTVAENLHDGDAAFFIAARAGWPAALRRALAAEARADGWAERHRIDCRHLSEQAIEARADQSRLADALAQAKADAAGLRERCRAAEAKAAQGLP